MITTSVIEFELHVDDLHVSIAISVTDDAHLAKWVADHLEVLEGELIDRGYYEIEEEQEEVSVTLRRNLPHQKWHIPDGYTTYACGSWVSLEGETGLFTQEALQVNYGDVCKHCYPHIRKALA